jgi:hypothetical protein
MPGYGRTCQGTEGHARAQLAAASGPRPIPGWTNSPAIGNRGCRSGRGRCHWGTGSVGRSHRRRWRHPPPRSPPRPGLLLPDPLPLRRWRPRPRRRGRHRRPRARQEFRKPAVMIFLIGPSFRGMGNRPRTVPRQGRASSIPACLAIRGNPGFRRWNARSRPLRSGSRGRPSKTGRANAKGGDGDEDPDGGARAGIFTQDSGQFPRISRVIPDGRTAGRRYS